MSEELRIKGINNIRPLKIDINSSDLYKIALEKYTEQLQNLKLPVSKYDIKVYLIHKKYIYEVMLRFSYIQTTLKIQGKLVKKSESNVIDVPYSEE